MFKQNKCSLKTIYKLLVFCQVVEEFALHLYSYDKHHYDWNLE